MLELLHISFQYECKSEVSLTKFRRKLIRLGSKGLLMPRYGAHEQWNAVEVAYRAANDPVSVIEELEEGSPVKQVSMSVGRPAELVHGSDTSLGVNEVISQTGRGHPDKIFVHAGDLASLTGCSLETGRRWLERFHEHGLLTQHGDGSTTEGDETHHVKLYLPRRVDRETVMRTLYDLEGRPSPDSIQDLTPVTPGDFQHLKGGVWQFGDEAEVTVDVTESSQAGVSLQDHVKSQLREHGLKPSSPKNFVYELRNKSGLT